MNEATLCLRVIIFLTYIVLPGSKMQLPVNEVSDKDLTVKCAEHVQPKKNYTYSHGAIIRGDTSKKMLALVFTGDEFAGSGTRIRQILKSKKIAASFFFTGRFYRNASYIGLIKNLLKDGHYLGPHSDQHLLYCDWSKRDSLLVSRADFMKDLHNNYKAMEKSGINRIKANYFLPPYEWYNDSISAWTKASGLELVNFTPGTRSNADYTFPEMGSGYRSSKEIFQSIISYENEHSQGMNGFILLLHIGADPRRKDPFDSYLPSLIKTLRDKGYQFVRVDNLLRS
jgi:endoglucanase